MAQLRAMNRPKALLFDLDGLLVDSEPTWFEVEGAFLAELGHTWTKELADGCMGQGTANTLRIWHERFGVTVEIERDVERIIDRMISKAPQMKLMTGVREVLEVGRDLGLPMAVASSSRRRLIEAVLDAKAISGFFAAVVSGQEVAMGKPAPDIFLRAAELLGVPIETCVVLEDALAGVRSGRASGAQVIAIPSVQNETISALATCVASSLLEVATWLKAPALSPAP